MERIKDPHLSQHDLERYHLGMVVEEADLAPLEEHILSCAHCAGRAEEIGQYVDAMRAAACTLEETREIDSLSEGNRLTTAGTSVCLTSLASRVRCWRGERAVSHTGASPSPNG